MTENLIWLFLAFMVKHFVCDFPLQVRYQYMNKGTYGHPGGIVHAGIHVIGTFLILLPFGVSLATAAFWGFVDGVLHYHVDWAKVQINKKYGLMPMNSEYYWWLLGADQLVHQLGYIWIIFMIVK